MPHSHGRDGINGRLLDSADADSGNSRAGGLSGQCQARQKRSWPPHRRFRLPVAAVSPFGRSAARFVPAPQDVCAIRSLLRHRDSLVEMATCHVQHIQKSLDQMNLQLHHVISDITGTTGLAILDAILEGNRDVNALAMLRDPRVRASHETIAKSLVGDYRQEHLFTLRQSVALYREYQKRIVDCEKEMQELMKSLSTKADLSVA